MKINKIVILAGLLLGFYNYSAAMEMSRENAFEELELQSDASALEIKKAYYSLAKQWHTDKNGSPEALEMIQKINRAYGILTGKEELPKEANFSQSFNFDVFFGQSGPEIYNNQFIFQNFHVAMQQMEQKLSNTVTEFSKEFEYNKNSDVISSKVYPIGSNQIITENILSNGLTDIEITNKIKKGFLGTTTFYERMTLTFPSDSQEIHKYRRQAKVYQQTQFRNSILRWTLGIGALAGATYLWVYHPEKIVEFKNNIVVPGLTKVSHFAKNFYAKNNKNS